MQVQYKETYQRLHLGRLNHLCRSNTKKLTKGYILVALTIFAGPIQKTYQRLYVKSFNLARNISVYIGICSCTSIKARYVYIHYHNLLWYISDMSSVFRRVQCEGENCHMYMPSCLPFQVKIRSMNLLIV